MGRSAKITRCVGLRQMKNAKKGVVKTSAKDRRRREKAERVQAALEAAAEERRQSRKEQLKEREELLAVLKERSSETDGRAAAVEKDLEGRLG